MGLFPRSKGGYTQIEDPVFAAKDDREHHQGASCPVFLKDSEVRKRCDAYLVTKENRPSSVVVQKELCSFTRNKESK